MDIILDLEKINTNVVFSMVKKTVISQEEALYK